MKNRKLMITLIFILWGLLITPVVLADLIEIPMELAYWKKGGNGNWQVTDEGIQLTLTDRSGICLDSKAAYNFIDSELFIKRKFHTDWGFGCSAAGGIMATEGSVGNAYFACGSTLLSRDTWYYSRIKVNSDKTYTSAIAINDYDTNGGTIIKTHSGTQGNRTTLRVLPIPTASIGIGYPNPRVGVGR